MEISHVEDKGKNSARLEAQRAHPDFNNNETGEIINPLIGLSDGELRAKVDDFIAEHDMADIKDYLHRGALVAQRPDEFESLNLPEDEKEALRTERDHKWRHPLALYLTIIVGSIGACVQGWDQTGSNGANLSFPDEFGISISDPTNPDYQRNNWLVGMVNSAPYMSAALLACWLCDPINHYIGRRGTIFLAGIFCLAAPIGSAFTKSWPELFVCRLILGLGVGLKETTAPVFTAENAPSRIRGALVMTWQLWTAFGILLGFCANLIFFKVGRIAWRLQLGSAMLPAIPLLALVYLCPESPRWYIKKGKYRKAYNSLKKLRFHEILAARDLFYISCLVEEERQAIGDTSIVKRFVGLFTVPRIRRATLAGSVVHAAQQFCGINIISFFSSSIFAAAAAPGSIQPLLASFGFGLINFVFAWPAIWTIDTFGRRTLLLFTFPNMTWSLLAAGFSFFIPKDNPARLGVIAFFIYLFTAFYSPGEGPVPFTYSAEIFPLSHRELGMCWCVVVNNLFACVLSLTWFRIQAAFTDVGGFGFYAGLNVLAFVMIFLWVPETKQRSLEELDYVFGVPTKTHMKYQCTVSLPYFVKRWILFQDVAKPQPLYHFELTPAQYAKEHPPVEVIDPKWG
ncbi:myo-inositol transporter 2 [Trichomonascus vanleenenianus]|uniref:myo-inositol transporter 2 n=1 Tax=Trichomonascus vanleenenianus TaxID=2268995 RepID=UPI003EC96B40